VFVEGTFFNKSENSAGSESCFWIQGLTAWLTLMPSAVTAPSKPTSGSRMPKKIRNKESAAAKLLRPPNQRFRCRTGVG